MSQVQEKSSVVPYSCTPRKPRSVPTELGERYYYKAKLSVGPNGEQFAERGEKVDLQAYIQASRASTDMATIIARYKAGDESVLNVTPNGYYGDVSIIPSSVNDLEKINKLSDIASEKFEQLPDAVKDAFGSSEAFLDAVLNNKVDKILSEYSSKSTEAPKEEESEGKE